MKLLTNFDLPNINADTIFCIGRIGLTNVKGIRNLIKLLKICNSTDLVFLNSPNPYELFMIYLIKTLSRQTTLVIVFDLILKKPEGFIGRAIAQLKGKFANNIDYICAINRYWDGYIEAYGIHADKFRYIPFKPNNYGLQENFSNSPNCNYVLALGASQRDYASLQAAAKGTGIPIKVACNRRAALEHNAKFSDEEIEEVEIIDGPIDTQEWNTLIAESCFVCIPIIKGTLQPAGISVYLEAMLMKKAVLITHGSSTIGILDDNLAYLVEEGNPKDIRRGLIELWNDSDIRAKLENNGYAYAKSLKGDARLRRDLADFVISAYDITRNNRMHDVE